MLLLALLIISAAALLVTVGSSSCDGPITITPDLPSVESFAELRSAVFGAPGAADEDPILNEYREAILLVEEYGDEIERLLELEADGRYGMKNLLSTIVATTPSDSDAYDFGLRYQSRTGSVDMPKARKYDPTFNCTAGFALMNSSLVGSNESRVVYTSEEYDYEGGHDLEKCPFFDEELGCYVDPTYEHHPRGECCHIVPYTQRAILMGEDQYYPGTCEADIICSVGDVTEAKPCGDGFICDERTTAEGAVNYPCAPGYVCGFGTTPDPSLKAPAGQFEKLCPERYQCAAGTGVVEKRDAPCPPNYFCPTGTVDAMRGSMATDGLNRDLDLSSEGNRHLVVFGADEVFSLDEVDDDTLRCWRAADDAIAQIYETRWKQPDDVVNSHLEYLARVEDRNGDGVVDPPYVIDPTVTNTTNAVRPEVVNAAVELALGCERDSKSNFVAQAIRRKECDCTQQLFALAASYRLWQCTSAEPLVDYGVGALQKPQQGRGQRDFWFDRVHRDHDLATKMDKAMEGYGLKWADGAVCEWPDSGELSLVAGRIPGIQDGLLSIDPNGPANLNLRFTWLENRTFASYSELKIAVQGEYANQVNLTTVTETSIDPFVYDLHHSIMMIEQYGARLESLVSFRGALAEEHHMAWGESRDEVNNVSSLPLQLIPGRLDICACQNLLKCPNGTHFYGIGAASIDDCKTNGNEILRRVSLLPPTNKTMATADVTSRISNETDFSELGGGHDSNVIDTITLQPLEVAIFELDLSFLLINMTYDEHYRLSVYVDCKPCPPRYRCDDYGSSTTGTRTARAGLSCAFPSKTRQFELLNECLQRERRHVCVKADGSDADVDWCQHQIAQFEKVDAFLEEKASFEAQHLFYTEPDLHKCLSMPYFCDESRWNFLTFRRLCQETLPDGSVGSPYDCSLADRWEEYQQWSNELCCSADPAFLGLEACINGTCADDNEVYGVLRSNFGEMFRQEYGFDPPAKQPRGSFIMDASIQQDLDHPAPLDLFNEWQRPRSFGSNETLKPHNVHHPSDSSIWRRNPGCCQCQPHPLPAFFTSTARNEGFPDNKHQMVQFTISALDQVDLTVVVELLHGQYYPDFDEYFSTFDKSRLRVHTPSRFAKTDERATWMAVLDRSVFDQIPLELPLNLPTTVYGDGKRVFENRILVDRPSDLEFGRFDILEDVIGSNSSDFYTSAGNRSNPAVIASYPVLDHPQDVQERVQWWYTGDETPLVADLSQEMSFIALPYLPFFSSCDGYDSHMSISRLLEEHPDCTIVPLEETKPINQHRLFNQLPPIGDFCQAIDKKSGVDLICSYEEDLEAPRERSRWYESGKEMVLFHLTSDAISSTIFEAKRSHDGIVQERWGRGLEIGALLDSHKLVPVVVDYIQDSMRNALPRIVELELEYFQIDKRTKRLVDASLKFGDLCTTLKPRRFGGNADLLDTMAARGIEPCQVDDVTGQVQDLGYTLRVNFHGVGWLGLMNRFQFKGSVYLIIFTLVGIISVLLALLVWGGCRIMTKLRYPPKLKLGVLARLVAVPSFYGVGLALIPTIICLTTVSIPANSLRHLDGTWMGSSVLDEARLESNHTGRIGSAMFSLGFYLTLLAVKALIPDFQRKRIRDVSLMSSEFRDEKDEHDGFGPSSSPWTPAFWRRAHLLWTSMCLQFVLLTVMEYSFSSGWENHIFQLIVLFKFLQIVLELVLEAVLKETLLVAPLLVVGEITQFVVTMGAADFTDFTLSHYISLALVVAERLCINPSIKRIKTLLPRWRLMLKRRFMRLRKQSEEDKERDEEEWRRANEEIEMHCEGIEPLLQSLGIYSVDATCKLLAPLVFSFFMVFYRQTCVAQKYGVQANELGYYTLFGFYMIPWAVVVDLLLLNSLELLYGWRISDYLSYQRYRFASRRHRWMLNSISADESVSVGLQTLDLMCLSSQYYALSSVFAIGMLLTMFGVTTFLRSEHNFLGDPGTPVIAFSMILVCEAVRRCLSYAATVNIDYFEWRGLWSTRESVGAMDDAVAAKLAVGVGSQAGLEQERMELQALNSERFRTRFIERNRPWILQHLLDLIPSETIKSMPPDGVEKIRDMYANLNSLGKGDRRPGDRPDISSDSDEDEDERERRRQWNMTPLRGDQVIVARSWLQRAQRRLTFGRLVQGLIDSNRASSCSFCDRKSHQCNTLAVSLAKDGHRDPYALDDLIRSFEEKYGEEEDRIELWRPFFRSKATYVTKCDICMRSSSQRQLLRQTVRVARAVDISSDEDSDSDSDGIVFDAVTVDDSASAAMVRWLGAARASLGENGGGGGSGARADAKVRAEMYRMALQRRSERKKRTANQSKEDGGSNREFENLQVDERSKTILSGWLRNARLSKESRHAERGRAIRDNLKSILGRLSSEEDWRWTAEFRLQGLDLVSQGERLDQQREDAERERDAAIDDVKENLATIKENSQKELDYAKISVNNGIDLAQHEYDQAIGEREQEIRRGAATGTLSEEQIATELSRERERMDNVIREKKDGIREVYEAKEEAILLRMAEAEANADAFVQSCENKCAASVTGEEKTFRQEASLWNEKASRHLRNAGLFVGQKY